MVRFRGRIGAFAVSLAAAGVVLGCGGGASEGMTDVPGKTRVTGTIGDVRIMAVVFVPIVDGKPDESKRETGAAMDGKYFAWVDPGKYEARAVDANGMESGKGPKVKEIDVGTEPVTLDVLEMPKSK